MLYTPAPLTRLFLIDDEGVVFSQDQQKLFALNTTASFVWICLEMGLETDRITAEYRDTFSVETHYAQSEIEHITSQWLELGLILREGQVTGGGRQSGTLPAEEMASTPCPADHTEQDPWTEKTYVLLGAAIRIQYTSREQFLCVHPALEHLQAETHANAPEQLISVLEIDNKYHLVRDGHCAGVVDSLNFLTARLKSLVLQTAINQFSYLVYFHAGVVEKNGACLMLPATAGSGKSTLTATLIRHGYNYLSDEIALLGNKNFQVTPAPISIGLKTGSWEVLKDLYPELSTLRTHDREDGKKVRYLTPPEGTIVRDNAAYPVKTIIFPNYEPSTETSLQPVTRVETLHRLFDDCMAIPVDLTLNQVEDMVNWIKLVDCYRLTMNDLDEAMSQVDSTR